MDRVTEWLLELLGGDKNALTIFHVSVNFALEDWERVNMNLPASMDGWLPTGPGMKCSKNIIQNIYSFYRRRCERSDQCGGFTYKGFITSDPAQKFRIFFFHFVLNFEDGVDSWNWVTYKSEKEYLRQGELGGVRNRLWHWKDMELLCMHGTYFLR